MGFSWFRIRSSSPRRGSFGSPSLERSPTAGAVDRTLPSRRHPRSAARRARSPLLAVSCQERPASCRDEGRAWERTRGDLGPIDRCLQLTILFSKEQLSKEQLSKEASFKRTSLEDVQDNRPFVSAHSASFPTTREPSVHAGGLALASWQWDGGVVFRSTHQPVVPLTPRRFAGRPPSEPVELIRLVGKRDGASNEQTFGRPSTRARGPPSMQLPLHRPLSEEAFLGSRPRA